VEKIWEEFRLSFSGDLYPSAGATSVLTTKGDLVDFDTIRQRLAIGSANQILQVKSNLPSWETVPLADTVLTTQGDVLYQNASGLARLGFGTSGFVLTTKGTGANPVWEASGGGAETHEFTTEETFTPTTQTGIMEVLIDTSDMTAGSIKTTVDGVIDNTISTATTLTRIYDPSTSITLISQAGGMGSSKSYTFSEVPAGNLVSVNIGDSGSKMYLASNQAGDNQSIYQYTLSTPYDVTTASYASISFPDPVSGDIRGMDFKSDGTTWIRCSDQTGNKKFYQFDCGTAWNISTSGSSVGDYDYSGTQSGGKTCIWGNSGTQVSSIDDYAVIYSYDTSAYDVSTCSPNGESFDCATFDDAPRALQWNSNGTKMYYLGSLYDKIYTIACSSAWDISSGTHNSADDVDVSGETTAPQGLAIEAGEVTPSYFYVGSGSSPYNVYEYELQAFSGSAYASVGQ